MRENLEIGNGVEAREGMWEADSGRWQWWVISRRKFWKALEDKFKFSYGDRGE